MTQSDSLKLMAVTTHTDGATELSMKAALFRNKRKEQKTGQSSSIFRRCLWSNCQGPSHTVAREKKHSFSKQKLPLRFYMIQVQIRFLFWTF